ncbi:MAG: glycosyltransferase family 4 protein [Aeriscardovia sp.]|nr:glycosyltransferase family 4 protein [Aeriscardovia sp.]
MKRILVLGAFGYRETLYDGQTIKTRNLFDLIKAEYKSVQYYDTQELQYSKLGYLKMLWEIVMTKYLVYLPAHNNLTYFFPLIFVLSKLFNIKIHYFVVGGWLKELIEDKPIHQWMLRQIEGIHCETRLMKHNLEKCYKFENVDTFPNFRKTKFVPQSHHTPGFLRVVFMARINKMKGLDLVFKLGDSINNLKLGQKISIDFYGPLQNEDNDEKYFNENIAKYSFMSYLGPVEPENIYTTLEKYDVMILPTHYYTEGLPGSVLDAYIAGIPVVVTNWKHAPEFVDDNSTGLIIPFKDDGSALFKSILHLLQNEELLQRMKHNARNKSFDYSAEQALIQIKKYIT